MQGAFWVTNYGKRKRLGRTKKKDADAKQNTVATKLNNAEYERFSYIADYKDLTISRLTREAIREYIAGFDEARKPKRGSAA